MRRNFLTEKTTSFASLASLFVAFFMALTPLALTACAPQATETPNPNPGVVNPVDPAEPEKPNVSQYSQILQTVLTDPTYIQMAKEIMHPLEYINKYIGYPYGFLSQQGYDIETLKKRRIRWKRKLLYN